MFLVLNQASDSTIEPDIIAEGHQVLSDTPEAGKYLLNITETVNKGKRGRPKKTKSPRNQSPKSNYKATHSSIISPQ